MSLFGNIQSPVDDEIDMAIRLQADIWGDTKVTKLVAGVKKYIKVDVEVISANKMAPYGFLHRPAIVVMQESKEAGKMLETRAFAISIVPTIVKHAALSAYHVSNRMALLQNFDSPIEATCYIVTDAEVVAIVQA